MNDLWNQNKDNDLPAELQPSAPMDDIPTQEYLNELMRPVFPPEGYYSRILLESWEYTQPTQDKPWGGYTLILKPLTGPNGTPDKGYPKVYIRSKRVWLPEKGMEGMVEAGLLEKLQKAASNQHMDDKTLTFILLAAGVDVPQMIKDRSNWGQILGAAMGSSISANIRIEKWERNGKSGENVRIGQPKPAVF